MGIEASVVVTNPAQVTTLLRAIPRDQTSSSMTTLEMASSADSNIILKLMEVIVSVLAITELSGNLKFLGESAHETVCSSPF